jgi:UMF1 family MFS transporter
MLGTVSYYIYAFGKKSVNSALMHLRTKARKPFVRRKKEYVGPLTAKVEYFAIVSHAGKRGVCSRAESIYAHVAAKVVRQRCRHVMTSFQPLLVLLVTYLVMRVPDSAPYTILTYLEKTSRVAKTVTTGGNFMLKQFTLKEKSWILYDWANSAYSSVITATIFPVFYKTLTKSKALPDSQADSLLGLALSLGALIVALLAPILGAIANFKGFKMALFRTFMAIGVVSTFLMAICPDWQWLLVVYAITIIGFNGSTLFYDAFLVEVTTDERMDKVSTYGYALGYIGGSTIPLIISIGLIFGGPSIGLDAVIATRISFVITAIWWMVFSLPMIRNVTQDYYTERTKHFIRDSFSGVISTLKNITKYKAVFVFLLAYFFYIDGVHTIIGIATSFGDTIGLDSTYMIAVLLGIQILAFPCAILFGMAAKKYGARALILFGIIVYAVICIVGFNMTNIVQFIVLAVLVATSQGGIQALSRSYFGRMIPKDRANEFFGFYDIFGKFASIMGPSLFAFGASVTGDSRYGVLAILLLFITGGIIFVFSWRLSPERR